MLFAWLLDLSFMEFVFVFIAFVIGYELGKEEVIKSLQKKETKKRKKK